MKVVIIGGVAGGASCAARLRRLDESAEIVIVERGPFISYANCGLPYHVGNIIEREANLLVASPALFREQFAISVRTSCEAIAVDPAAKTVTLRDLATGHETKEAYDKLVLAPGAASVKPPLPGIDLPGIFHIRTVPDARAIRGWIDARRPSSGTPRAVVIGGGFIGLEMTENLVHRGFAVSLIEMQDQVLPPLDVEQARTVEGLLRSHGVELALGESVTGFSEAADRKIGVATRSGRTFSADLVILALGVRPDTTLARSAGLSIGGRGGIRVDNQMRTSEPDIFAVGDAVEVQDFVTGLSGLLALAGPANRQGRIAADAIAGRASEFRGTQGTAVIGLFGTTIAWTGSSEKALRSIGRRDFETVDLYPNSHARYYPGAKPIAMKVVFSTDNGRILGAQAIGEDGADKRIDVISAFIQMRGTIYDLEEAELCYAPQYGSAKDAVNFAGMIAANAARGDMPLAHWPVPDGAFVLDVREPSEIADAPIPGARNIPLKYLRQNMGTLPKETEILVTCRSGQRAYLATRILLQNGFAARTLTGGFLSRDIKQKKS